MRLLSGFSLKWTLWNAIFVLFLLSLLVQFSKQLFSTYGYESWHISEFLINYQGGFVRRGLTGEILFFFVKNFNLDVEWTIKIFCLACAIAVCAFFVKSFLNKGYTLYLLPLCFFLGNGVFNHDWIRKDYLFFCFLIPILWLCNKDRLSFGIRIPVINILSVLIIFSHEVFAFFSLPLLFLLFFDRFKSKGIARSALLSLLCLSPGIFAFSLCVVFHGNQETAQGIWGSWMSLLNRETSSASDMGGAVTAIGWSSVFAVLKHIGNNFFSLDQRISGLLVWTVTFPAVYYIATNALRVFKKREDDFTRRHKTVLSSVLVFQLLCLSPVFMVLSCDYIRVFFYWTASSFTLFLLLPLEKIESLFPACLFSFAERINKVLADILPPSRAVLALLMMFIGITPFGFNALGAIHTTMSYNVLSLLSMPLQLFRTVLLESL